MEDILHFLLATLALPPPAALHLGGAPPPSPLGLPPATAGLAAVPPLCLGGGCSYGARLVSSMPLALTLPLLPSRRRRMWQLLPPMCPAFGQYFLADLLSNHCSYNILVTGLCFSDILCYVATVLGAFGV